MSKMEFVKIEDVLQFIMYELPRRAGKYYFRRRSIVYKEDEIIAFQYDSKIIASAILVGQSLNGKIENGVEYKGVYKFDPSSFVVCNNPITSQEIKDIMQCLKGLISQHSFYRKNV
jgi:hypothetical protein